MGKAGKFLKEVLSGEKDVNYQLQEWIKPFPPGATPVMIAAYYGKTRTLQKLINMGADLSIRDIQDWGPLEWATYGEAIEIGNKRSIRLLEERGLQLTSAFPDRERDLKIASMIEEAIDENMFSNSNDAVRILKEAIPLAEKNFGKKNYIVASIYYYIGNIYHRNKAFDLATESYLKALDIFWPLTGGYATQVMEILQRLGMHNYILHHYDRVEKFYLDALKIQETYLSKNKRAQVEILVLLCIFYYTCKKEEKLRHCFERLIQIGNKTRGRNRLIKIIDPMVEIGNFFRRLELFTAAYPAYRFAEYFLDRSTLSPPPAILAEIYYYMGLIMFSAKQYRVARKHLEKALRVEGKIYKPDSPKIISIKKLLGFTILHLGKKGEREKMYKESMDKFLGLDLLDKILKHKEKGNGEKNDS